MRLERDVDAQARRVRYGRARLVGCQAGIAGPKADQTADSVREEQRRRALSTSVAGEPQRMPSSINRCATTSAAARWTSCHCVPGRQTREWAGLGRGR